MASDAQGSAPAEGEEQKTDNKVAASIGEKGENSYYFAHAMKKDDLSKATLIEGDGSCQLASAGGMQKLDKAEELQTMQKVKWREDYAWADEKGKVKLYLEFPEGSLGHPDVKVETKYEELSFQVLLHGVGGGDEVYGITNGEHRLSGKIVPEKCSWRFNSSKSRLTVTLVKAEPEEGVWSTLKKHVISQHTGWN
mmetsp:Transcript_35312/g.112358  ORF Transcript_35312/g.112358 Transcript_35312/m.112358 type:complete len:195 (-) Transcript_35312:123-707(-)